MGLLEKERSPGGCSAGALANIYDTSSNQQYSTLRSRAEGMAERLVDAGEYEAAGVLIAALDALDGDTDLEPETGHPPPPGYDADPTARLCLPILAKHWGL